MEKAGNAKEITVYGPIPGCGYVCMVVVGVCAVVARMLRGDHAFYVRCHG